MEQRSKNVTVIFDMSGTLMRSWIFMRMHLEPETYGCYFQIQNANKCNLALGVITTTLCVISALLFQTSLADFTFLKWRACAIGPQCLKITEKVSFNIASEASYVYILSGQKILKMPKMINFGEFLKSWIFGQTVLPDRSILIGQKLVENGKLQKFKCDILSNFQTMCSRLDYVDVKN